MNTTKILGSSLIALSLLGIGCNPFAGVQQKMEQKIGENIAEGILEKASGGKVDVDTETGGFSIKDKESGETATFGTDALPANFPSDLPRYPGGKIVIASATEAGKKATLAQTVEADAATVLAWYDSTFRAKGYTTESEINGASNFREYVKGDAKIGIAVLGQPSDEGKAIVSITAVYEMK